MCCVHVRACGRCGNASIAMREPIGTEQAVDLADENRHVEYRR